MTEEYNIGNLRIHSSQIVWILLLAVVLFFSIVPVRLPIAVGNYAQKAYDHIENLPAGSVVLIDTACDIGLWMELGPGETAILQHLMRRPVKVILVSWWPDGALFHEKAVESVDKTGKKYGEDWVNLGYIAGVETAIAAFTKDIRALVKTDLFGTPIDQLPMMKGVNKAEDISLIIPIFQSEADVWARQWTGPYQTKVICIATKFSQPGAMPFVTGGQYLSILAGSRDAAEYELLVGIVGRGLKATSAFSGVYLLGALLPIAGSIIELRRRQQPKTGGTT